MPVSDAEMDGLEQRLKDVAPKVVNTLIDLIEGRKFIALETTEHPHGGGRTTILHICDNPDTPPAT